MNAYFFIFEVEPQTENPLIAHVSRAAVHMWVMSTGLNEARDSALGFLQSEGWELTGEKEGYLATPEQVAGLEGEALSNYETAQSEGTHAKYYYWHRSE